MDRVLKWIGVVAMVSIVLTANFVAVLWIWQLPIWGSLDSGWVQAWGSIAALGIAIYIMRSQSRDAIKLVARSDRTTLVRRASAVQALVENCNAVTNIALLRLADALHSTTAPRVILAKSVTWSESLEESRSTLVAVPLHELGSAELVVATLGTMENMLFLNNTLGNWRTRGAAGFDVAEACRIVDHYRHHADKHLMRYNKGLETLSKD